METKHASSLFEVLASDVRLDIFKLLVKHAPEGLFAGEIAQKLDIAPNNLSFHLKALTHSGLAALEKEGRFIRYKANTELMFNIVEYLTAECCSASSHSCCKK
jgi:ArsR family transcriptional regulator